MISILRWGSKTTRYRADICWHVERPRGNPKPNQTETNPTYYSNPKVTRPASSAPGWEIRKELTYPGGHSCVKFLWSLWGSHIKFQSDYRRGMKPIILALKYHLKRRWLDPPGIWICDDSHEWSLFFDPGDHRIWSMVIVYRTHHPLTFLGVPKFDPYHIQTVTSIQTKRHVFPRW